MLSVREPFSRLLFLTTTAILLQFGALTLSAFEYTGSLATPRFGHTATLLSNGKVLVTGGFAVGFDQTGCELYDPATGTWTATGSLNFGRFGHAATLLPNGKVLVVGRDNSHKSAELYDPATEKWTV